MKKSLWSRLATILTMVVALTFLGLSAFAADQKEAPTVPAASAKTTSVKPADSVTVKDTPVLANHKVIAYYFHGNKRCVSCRKIEAYTKEAIDSAYAKELASGALEWKVINTDSTQNEHFLADYELYTKSVVLSELQDGKQIRWKNLAKVWELLGDQKGFHQYIQTELKPFLDSK